MAPLGSRTHDVRRVADKTNPSLGEVGKEQRTDRRAGRASEALFPCEWKKLTLCHRLRPQNQPNPPSACAAPFPGKGGCAFYLPMAMEKASRGQRRSLFPSRAAEAKKNPPPRGRGASGNEGSAQRFYAAQPALGAGGGGALCIPAPAARGRTRSGALGPAGTRTGTRIPQSPASPGDRGGDGTGSPPGIRLKKLKFLSGVCGTPKFFPPHFPAGPASATLRQPCLLQPDGRGRTSTTDRGLSSERRGYDEEVPRPLRAEPRMRRERATLAPPAPHSAGASSTLRLGTVLTLRAPANAADQYHKLCLQARVCQDACGAALLRVMFLPRNAS